MEGASIVREVDIPASPEIVWPYLVQPDLYVRWEGTKAELDPRPGGIYRVHVTPGFVAVGEFLEVEPPSRVLYRFGWEGEGSPIPPGGSLVEITLEAVEGGTHLIVRHSLPDEAVDDHKEGWDYYLARLIVAASGGDPGPDPRARAEQ